MHWKNRIKRRIGKGPLTTPHVEPSPTPPAPEDPSTPSRVEPSPTPPASDPPTSPLSLRVRLWNKAYDQAKTSDSSTVDAYEKILSVRLSEPDPEAPNPLHPIDLASQENKIAPDVDKRRIQMDQLVQNGLRRTEKDAKVKQGIEQGIQTAMMVKQVVDKAIQASPEAAIAWVGVCFGLEILLNTLTEASSNRQGIVYVVLRMEWYWNLSSLLLDEHMTVAHSKGVRDHLEEAVTRLYAKLLLYQMKSVCYYHRNRFATLMRDLVKRENWDGELSDIKTAEEAVKSDSEQYNTSFIRAQLNQMVETAKSQNAILDSISAAIREQTRLQERMQETSEDKRCLVDLRLTDPRNDKKRIEETKGGLLKDAYRWVLDHPDFRRWRDDAQTQLLWVKADPGKGKTMLLCGIIDELQESLGSTSVLSYFFCQATDARINSATAVLRGLLYMLMKQQPSLVSYVREEYDDAGKNMFEDANAWVALDKIFTNVLQDPDLDTTFLIIDALDECVTDLPKLLVFVAKHSSAFSHVKWIVSSRNWPNIEAELERAGHKVKLSLELNAQSIAAAVDVFIQRKVDQLAREKHYKPELRHVVLEHLRSNANDTFLWVALVCQDLERTEKWNVLKKLVSFPPGLDALYERMMQQIGASDNAELCKQVLAVIALVYRPIKLAELVALTELLEDTADEADVREIIGLCGSFLTLREDTVYFVHQSAKDFLVAKAPDKTFPDGIEVAHSVLFSRSLAILSKTLRRDMYSLDAPGYPAEQVELPDPDPLAASRYSCIYWIDHLCDWSLSTSTNSLFNLQDRGIVHEFLEKKYLYWLEALSLCKSMSAGVISMARLEALVQGRTDATALTQLVQDARRFILYHTGAIENSPLQTYASALLFSPTGSVIRRLFQHEKPEWITIEPAMGDSWSACLQTFEGHSNSVESVAFSHNSTRLASASHDMTVKIWDASSGACLQTFKGHSDKVMSVVFSHDSTQLASASHDMTVKIWDASSGACLQTFKGHSDKVMSVVFSHDSTQLASASHDRTVKIWKASSGACLQTLTGHSDYVYSVVFSHDSMRLASASYDRTVKIWEASSGARLQTLTGHSNYVNSVVFSHDSTQLASASYDRTIKIWEASSGACLQTLESHSDKVMSVAFSHDSTQLASASDDKTVKIWEASSGACLQTLKGHSGWVNSVAFLHDSTQLVSASDDKTVKVWEASSGACLQPLEAHSDKVMSVVFSHDSTQLASASDDKTVKVWEASSGACLQTLKGHSDDVNSVAFSHDSTRLASASHDMTVKIWDASSGACLQTLTGHTDYVYSVVFSHDSMRLASASDDKTVKIWEASSGACLQTLKGHSDDVNSVAFSHDSTRLASASHDMTVKFWDASSGACLQTLKGHNGSVRSVAFSPDSTRLASASYDGTVKIWDASSGACLQMFNVGKALYSLSFDVTGSCLITEIGSMDISTSIGIGTKNVTVLQRPQYLGVGVSPDSTWITCNGKNLLWIPSEYRPSCSSACGNTISMGVGSGRIWSCSINLRT